MEGRVFCPYWSLEPMCDCEVCREEIQRGEHISQTNPNAEAYCAARVRLGLTVAAVIRPSTV